MPWLENVKLSPGRIHEGLIDRYREELQKPMKLKRLAVIAFLTLAVMVYFWTVSRYPDLGVKTEVGPDMILDGLGFDVVYPVESGDSYPLQAAKRTVNWMKTNLKGMIFGLFVAAAFQSLLGMLSRKSFKSGWANTLLGVGVGAPMGLCVNCAAPISGGMYRGGARVETSLAAMLASPTLNVIVLGFLLTMLPWHLAALKIVATLLLLLVAVPLLTRGWKEKACEPDCEETTEESRESWGRAVPAAILDLGKNLASLSARLVPSMLLAGALGSVLITAVPFYELERFGRPGLVALVLVSLLGTFFPVPISFDVILCALLYNAGMPVEIVAVLLFTLGSYSIYSFAVVAQTISVRLAVKVFATVTVLGVLVGLTAGQLERAYRDGADKELLEQLTRVEYEARPTSSYGTDIFELERGGPRSNDSSKVWTALASASGMKLEQKPLEPRSPEADTLFTPMQGEELGLEVPVVLGYLEHLTIPTVSNRSISSGDVNGDGWTDLVVANDVEVGGVTLLNNVDGRFFRRSLDLGDVKHDFVTVCALVDIDNDGQLDLYLSTINGDNRVLLNDRGDFERAVMLPTLPGAFVNAVGFADIDKDGDLDIVMGTWVHRFFRTHRFRGWNYILLQNELQFEPVPLSGDGGNCHTLLLSDWNDDGFVDLAFGHDSRPPDEFYLGNGTAHPTQIGAETFPRSTQWTMSLDTADLNNDLRLSLFADHIAYDTDERGRHKRAAKQDRGALLKDSEREAVEYMIATDEIHDRLRRGGSVRAALAEHVLEPHDLPEVLVDAIISRYWRGEDRQAWAEQIEGFPLHLRRLFERVFPARGEQPPKRVEAPAVTQVPSSKSANVLLEWDGTRWVDRANKWGLEFTEWSWNAKFADLNLDGFQDLYLVNGSYQEALLNPNMLFLNQQGQTFQRIDDQGTRDYFPCSNYTYIDFDNDGDLDIVLAPQNGALRCLRNNSREGRSIGFALNDRRGVRTGVGGRVLIRYEGGSQLKELKASGGFNSFDAPVVWFGLGRSDTVDELSVRWSDGSWSTLKEPLKAGFLYRVTRSEREGSQNGSPG